MHFDQSELQQLTPDYIDGLPSERKAVLLEQLRKDLMEAHDRLNQNPSNSSRPPSSRPPWDRSVDGNSEPEKENPKKDSGNQDDNDPHSEKPSSKNTKDKQKRRPGKQPGAKGFGRTQNLEITQEIIHKPTCCSGCGEKLNEDQPFQKTGGHHTIDLELPEGNRIGLHAVCIKHIYGSMRCGCGFENTTKPNRVPNEPGWGVEMGEWRLIGPHLLAFLVFLKMRMHMTISKSRELLLTWMGISLSDGCINTALREAGRAISSLEPELIKALISSGLLHVDETGWKEHKVTRWFWVAISDNVACYTVGPRSSETAEKILKGFNGWLMTDGYIAYRKYKNRVRCWAHLERKAKALEESWDEDVASFGAYAVKTFESLRRSVYKMRETSPSEREEERYNCDQERIGLLTECVRRDDSDHEATRCVCR